MRGNAAATLTPALAFGADRSVDGSGGRFPLTPRSRPEMAIVWKNVMLVQRLPFKTLFAAGIALIALLIVTVPTGFLPARWVGVLQIGGAALMIFPPLFSARTLRNDLRTDLLKLEMIRPWPLPGARMFLAQVAVPFILIAMRVGFGALLLVSVDTAIELGLINFANGAGPAESSGLWEAAAKTDLAAGLGVSPMLLTPLVVLGVLPLSLTVALLSIGLENLGSANIPRLGPARPEEASGFPVWPQPAGVHGAIHRAVLRPCSGRAGDRRHARYADLALGDPAQRLGVARAGDRRRRADSRRRCCDRRGWR